MSVLVVLDTNVVVSAGIQPASHSARIVEAALAGAIIAVVSATMATEFIEVATSARFKRWTLPSLWLNALILGAHLVDQDLPAWPSASPDPDDQVFLALAHRTGAVRVTGNDASYPTRIRHGVEVMGLAAYVRHLESLGVRC